MTETTIKTVLLIFVSFLALYALVSLAQEPSRDKYEDAIRKIAAGENEKGEDED